LVLFKSSCPYYNNSAKIPGWQYLFDNPSCI
jgi:hypothetical protein